MMKMWPWVNRAISLKIHPDGMVFKLYADIMKVKDEWMDGWMDQQFLVSSDRHGEDCPLAPSPSP